MYITKDVFENLIQLGTNDNNLARYISPDMLTWKIIETGESAIYEFSKYVGLTNSTYYTSYLYDIMASDAAYKYVTNGKEIKPLFIAAHDINTNGDSYDVTVVKLTDRNMLDMTNVDGVPYVANIGHDNDAGENYMYVYDIDKLGITDKAMKTLLSYPYLLRDTYGIENYDNVYRSMIDKVAKNNHDSCNTNDTWRTYPIVEISKPFNTKIYPYIDYSNSNIRESFATYFRWECPVYGYEAIRNGDDHSSIMSRLMGKSTTDSYANDRYAYRLYATIQDIRHDANHYTSPTYIGDKVYDSYYIKDYYRCNAYDVVRDYEANKLVTYDPEVLLLPVRLDKYNLYVSPKYTKHLKEKHIDYRYIPVIDFMYIQGVLPDILEFNALDESILGSMDPVASIILGLKVYGKKEQIMLMQFKDRISMYVYDYLLSKLYRKPLSHTKKYGDCKLRYLEFIRDYIIRHNIKAGLFKYKDANDAIAHGYKINLADAIDLATNSITNIKRVYTQTAADDRSTNILTYIFGGKDGTKRTKKAVQTHKMEAGEQK